MDFKRYKTGFFSMEIGINDNIPTYAGGLGILAGDALKSCADLELPVIGVTLLYRKGYFKQKIDEEGNQSEENQDWDYENILEKLDTKVKVKIKGEEITVGCWLNKDLPLIFLDTDFEENPEYYRRICDKLYQGNKDDRIVQEIILGIGGIKILESLNCSIEKCHMNEGHTAFLILELLKQKKDVKNMCIFTTHTPVPAGHDIFEEKKVREYLPDAPDEIFENNELNMTKLALKFSGFINGVARKHRKTSRMMFPDYDIESITNGIYTKFWVTEPFKELFNKNIPEWYEDPFSLRSAMNIPGGEVLKAHQKSKEKLIEEVKKRTGEELDKDVFTIGFARRFVEYKRPGLIFYNIDKLKPMQIIFSGKAHPQDPRGKELIKEIYSKKNLKNVKVVFLEDYNMETAKLMVSGCDVWLSNPRRPYEASGTSGMKAAVNGVPHFSTLDGWWLEGHVEDVTGWSIGLHPHDPDFDEDTSPDDEAEDFYNKLEKVMKMYKDKKKWQWIMKACIAINGSFFNSNRMMQQYVIEAYIK